MDGMDQYNKKRECRHFSDCSAPFCPLAMNTRAQWLPQDEICRNSKFRDSIIVRNQRKIKRRSGNNSTYFSYESLSREFIIRKGIVGIDPDVPESASGGQSLRLYSERERSWLKKHSPITEERKAQLRSIGKQMVLDAGDRQ